MYNRKSIFFQYEFQDAFYYWRQIFFYGWGKKIYVCLFYFRHVKRFWSVFTIFFNSVDYSSYFHLHTDFDLVFISLMNGMIFILNTLYYYNLLLNMFSKIYDKFIFIYLFYFFLSRVHSHYIVQYQYKTFNLCVHFEFFPYHSLFSVFWKCIKV